MMITPTTILRDCAVALPLLVGVGWWWGGTGFAFGVACSGLVAIANLGLLAWLVDRAARISEAGGGARGWVVLPFKTLVVLAAVVALLGVFDALAVLLGFGVAIAGMTVRGLVYALRMPEPVEEVP